MKYVCFQNYTYYLGMLLPADVFINYRLESIPCCYDWAGCIDHLFTQAIGFRFQHVQVCSFFEASCFWMLLPLSRASSQQYGWLLLVDLSIATLGVKVLRLYLPPSLPPSRTAVAIVAERGVSEMRAAEKSPGPGRQGPQPGHDWPDCCSPVRYSATHSFFPFSLLLNLIDRAPLDVALIIYRAL